MSTNELIVAEDFCTGHAIDLSLIHSLHESGLIEVITLERKVFLKEEQLPQLEKLVHFYEMGINIEGMEAVTHLLELIHDMQGRLRAMDNDSSVSPEFG